MQLYYFLDYFFIVPFKNPFRFVTQQVFSLSPNCKRKVIELQKLHVIIEVVCLDNL